MANSIHSDRYDEAPCFETVVDVVGLEHSNRGRCCERHGVCGDIVEINSVLMLEKTCVCECLILKLELYF